MFSLLLQRRLCRRRPLNPFTPHHYRSLFFFFQSPRRPHKEQYNDYYYRERRHSEYEEEEEDPFPEYERNWRDWFYDNRKRIYGAGAVGLVGGGYYWYHLEDAPITGRRRFISMSPSQERQLAESSFQEMIQQYRSAILPSTHPATRFVEKVARRIIAAIDPSLSNNQTRWRIFVIESSIANAFVLPGGEIFVFTGLLPIAANEDGLAAIIGHEVAHQIARHGAEKMSFYQFFSLASSALQLLIIGDFLPFSRLFQELFLFLPFSRKCETEADHIGLLLMAKACYDPTEAIGLWQRMSMSSDQVKPPALLSTHPSNEARIEKIRELMPKAMAQYEESDCYQLKSSFFRSFS